MPTPIPYDTSWTALLQPWKNAVFFADGWPASQAHLCAELSRLAYLPFEQSEHFAQVGRDVLRGQGFTRAEFLSRRGSQAYWAYHPAEKLGVLVFRGTETVVADWWTDAQFWRKDWHSGGAVHAGFAAALEDVWPDVERCVASRLSENEPRDEPRDEVETLVVTGHSLGAALATLAASRLRPTRLITFGSPRVGDAGFVQTVSDIDHQRYVNCCDLVAKVPPGFLGYVHAGPPRYIDRHGQEQRAMSDREMQLDQRQGQRDYPHSLNAVPLRQLADHAPINYLSAFTGRRPAVSP